MWEYENSLMKNDTFAVYIKPVRQYDIFSLFAFYFASG